MHSSPLVTISIISFNTKKLLLNCLASVYRAIGHLPAEVIVVDNASTDGSADAVEQEFPQATLIRNETNLGFGSANNIAYNHSSSDYFVMINPDAELEPDALILAVAHMEKNRKAGLGGAHLSTPDGKWQPSARMFPSLLNRFLEISALADYHPSSSFFGRYNRTWAHPKKEALVDWIPGAFSILRRSALDEELPFDPRFFLYSEEVDLCKRLKAAGYEIWYWPDIHVWHIGGESCKSISKNLSLGNQLVLWQLYSSFLYFRKHHGSLYTQFMFFLEGGWLKLRRLKHQILGNKEKVDKLSEEIDLVNRAWSETSGGKISPLQPWRLP